MVDKLDNKVKVLSVDSKTKQGILDMGDGTQKTVAYDMAYNLANEINKERQTSIQKPVDEPKQSIKPIQKKVVTESGDIFFNPKKNKWRDPEFAEILLQEEEKQGLPIPGMSFNTLLQESSWGKNLQGALIKYDDGTYDRAEGPGQITGRTLRKMEKQAGRKLDRYNPKDVAYLIVKHLKNDYDPKYPLAAYAGYFGGTNAKEVYKKAGIKGLIESGYPKTAQYIKDILSHEDQVDLLMEYMDKYREQKKQKSSPSRENAIILGKKR